MNGYFKYGILLNIKKISSSVSKNCRNDIIYINKFCIPLSHKSNDSNVVNFSTCSLLNAGHAKWQNIQHIKAAKDRLKGTTFQQFAKNIQLATKEPGGNNPDLNVKLARVIESAMKAKMPSSSIDRAVKLAETQSKNAKPHTIAMVGSGGVYIVTDVVTDKLTRCRHTLLALGKKIGLTELRSNTEAMFDEKGVIITVGSENSLSNAMDDAIESDAEDVTFDNGYFTFLCSPFDFPKVKKSLEDLKYTIEYADIDKLPVIFGSIKENDTAAFKKIMNKIEALDEVSRVQINFEL